MSVPTPLILVVDDDIALAEMLAAALGDRGDRVGGGSGVRSRDVGAAL